MTGKPVQWLQGSATYLAANLLSAAIPFLLIPVLTRYLGPEGYGTVAVFQSVVGLLGAFVGLNVAGAVARRLYDPGITGEAIGELLVACLQVTLLSAGFVALVAGLAGEQLERWLGLDLLWIHAAVTTSAAALVIQLQLNVWQARQRALSYGALQVLQGALGAALTLVLIVGFAWGAEGRLVSQIAAAVLCAILSLLLLRRAFPSPILAWRGERLRSVLAFGVPLVPHIGGIVLLTTFDRLVVDAVLGRTEVGLYMVAVQITLTMGLLFDALNKASVPWLYARLASADATSKARMVRQTYLGFVATLAVAALVFALGRPLITWIAGPDFVRGAEAIGWLALGQAFSGMYLLVTNYVFYAERTGLLAMATLAAGAVNLAILPFFVGAWGLQGAGAAFCLSMALRFVLTWGIAQRVVPMPWFPRRQPR